MDLRQQIADIVIDTYYDENDRDSTTTADLILSLPSGLVATKECESYKANHGRYYGAHSKGSDVICTECHGTGTISRDLTLQEVVEFSLEYVTEFHKEFGKDMPVTFMKTGERVEVKP
jgi:hypothetical protein